MNTLRKIRKSMGMTQDKVEKLTGIDASTLSMYENGKKIPTVKNAKILAEIYGVRWTSFFEEGVENDGTGTGSN